MKILYVSSDNNCSSGAFICMVKLVKYLKEMEGIEDIVVLLPKNGDGEKMLRENEITYVKLRAFSWVVPFVTSFGSFCKRNLKIVVQLYNIIAVRKMRKIIREREIDFVHLNTIFAHYGAIAAKLENVPYVWHIREILSESFDSEIFCPQRGTELINDAEKIICVSDNVVDSIREKIKLEKIVRVYDGVEIEKYYVRNKTILQNEKISFVMVGNIAEYKGQLLVVQALGNLDIEYQLTFIGEGEKNYLNSIKQQIRLFGMEDKVTFTGKVGNVQDYLKEADVVFVCSRREAFGRVTIEAMLSGNLVVAANSGATPEIIEDGNSGLLFEFKQIEDLKNCILFVANNKLKAQKIAKNGQLKALQSFSDRQNAEKIYEVYRKNGLL